MARRRVEWENEDDEDNLPYFSTVNDTSIGASSAEAAAVEVMGLDTFSSLSDTLLERNGSLYPNDEHAIIYYSDNGTSGESECFGCNSTMLDVLNMSTGNNSQHQGNDHDHDALYEVPLSMIICLSLLYGAISVSALVGNTLVLWIVAVSRRMRTVTNMFIANLALADIIIGLFTIPFQFQAALLQRWNLPDFMCAFCPFIQVLSVNVSVFTLSAIAVDRYRAVLYPLSARVSKRKAAWVILSIWAVAFLLALPTELDYKVTSVEDKVGTKPFCSNVGLPPTFRMYYHQSIVVIQYFFPLVIISVAYVHMGVKLWGATAPGNKEESRDAVVLRNKKKVIKMLALVVLMFGLCWLPLQTYNFFQTIFPSINEFQYINVLWFGFHSLAMSNSCCNPFIYAIYNDKFQREFQTRLRCLRRCYKTREDGNYSDGSDIDRSKIRASYRFTNNRCGGSNVNTRSGCNYPTSRTNLAGESKSSRCSLYSRCNVADQNIQCSLHEQNECQGNKRYLGVGTFVVMDNSQQLNNHTRHHNRRHRRHRPRHGGPNVSSEASSSSGNNNSSGSFTNEIMTELECSSSRINGNSRAEGSSRYRGNFSNFETETQQQETSFTVTNLAAATNTTVAVVTANGRTVMDGSNKPITPVTHVANNSACNL